MEPRLLARLIDAARTVVPISAMTATASVSARLAGGSHLQAEVAERIDDSHFRVLIDGKPILLKLPPGIKTGDLVQLRVIESAPRLKLVLDTTQPAPSAAAVSNAGRLVGTLLTGAPAAPLRQSLPVVGEPTAAPTELTGPLARAIERSGLFYESHQARWIAGEYPLERLREEPQARATLQRAEAPAVPDRQPEPTVATLPHTRADTSNPRSLQAVTSEPETPSAKPAAAVHDSPAAEARTEIAARETLPIVRQQLETLENRALAWLGEIWPGQAMRWEIAEQHHDRDGSGADADWGTCFELNLPLLGDVGAALTLTPTGLRIRLTGHDSTTVAAMQTGLSELRGALAAAGVEATDIQVRQDGSPD